MVLAGRPLHASDSAAFDGERSVRFGEEMALANADVSGIADDVTVNLTWLPLGPILHDYRISVQIQGAGWQAQDDSAPALGAIPTTKWIAGAWVMDRHHINIPSATPRRNPCDRL